MILGIVSPSTKELSAHEVFKRNLRHARRRKNISQEELELSVNLSRTYVCKAGRAKRNVSTDNIGDLVREVGISFGYLVAHRCLIPSRMIWTAEIFLGRVFAAYNGNRFF